MLTELTCTKCDAPLNLRRGKRGPWLGCSRFPKCKGRAAWSKLEEPVQKALLAKLEANDKANPPIVIHSIDGEVIPEGTPIAELIIAGGMADLEIHPEAAAQPEAA